MYPKAQTPVRFPLEWLGKPHGGLENITEQQNNNVCGREGGGGRTTEGTDAGPKAKEEGGRSLGRSQPNTHDD